MKLLIAISSSYVSTEQNLHLPSSGLGCISKVARLHHTMTSLEQPVEINSLLASLWKLCKLVGAEAMIWSTCCKCLQYLAYM